jgi:hypothetical protein
VCLHGQGLGKETARQQRHSTQERPTARETARLRGKNIVMGGEGRQRQRLSKRDREGEKIEGTIEGTHWEHWQDEGECGVATFRDVPTVDFLVCQNSLSRFSSCL